MRTVLEALKDVAGLGRSGERPQRMLKLTFSKLSGNAAGKSSKAGSGLLLRGHVVGRSLAI